MPSRARRWAPETAEVADTLRAADPPAETAEATAQVLAFWEQDKGQCDVPVAGQGCPRPVPVRTEHVDESGQPTRPGSMTWASVVERVTRIELALWAWESAVLGSYGRH
ncbi:DUF1932 domain-containing protein [Streptomyces cyaneofuscatus]|uniref:DUF1932 domain-containing protein n=1 Tax=Streptomyces cyaneofuscatus TaxID=66883 RepID=UPI0033BD639A